MDRTQQLVSLPKLYIEAMKNYSVRLQRGEASSLFEVSMKMPPAVARDVDRYAAKIAKRPRTMGFVYVLHTPSGFYKIGHTHNLAQRLREHDTLGDPAFTLVCSFRCHRPEIVEAALHSRFKGVRIRRELFALTDEHLAWIGRMKGRAQLYPLVR